MDGASSPSCRPSMRNCRRPFNEVGPTPGSFGPFHIPPGPGEPRPALLLSARRSRLACRKQPSRGPGLYSALRPPPSALLSPLAFRPSLSLWGALRTSWPEKHTNVFCSPGDKEEREVSW